MTLSGKQALADAASLFRQGQEALARGAAAEALAYLTRVLALAPDLPAAHIACGVALHHLGRSQEAIQAMCRATAINPDEEVATRWLRMLLGITGSFGQIGNRSGVSADRSARGAGGLDYRRWGIKRAMVPCC